MTVTVPINLPFSGKVDRTLNLPFPESQRVRGLSLIHDGSHWSGSFLAAARHLLTDLLTDGPFIITVYADDNITANPAPDAVMRLTGTAIGIDDRAITFEDGQTIEIERLISVHI